MKKIISFIFIVSIIGCHSSDTTTSGESKNNNEAGVQNVNGNLPDTTNAINLSTQKKDSTQKSTDTTRK